MTVPDFTLIVATLGRRPSELERLLASVTRQAVPVQVVLAVQENREAVMSVADRYADHFDISVVDAPRGLSRARNAALPAMQGAIVAFPDDDAWYPAGLLTSVSALLAARPDLDGMTCPQLDDEGASSARWSPTSGLVTVRGAWTRMASSTIFVRRRVVEAVGPFDEELGVGAGTPWEGAEDLDFVIRVVKAGFAVHYNTALSVRHPVTVQAGGIGESTRAYRYGAGVGRTWRKNGVGFLTVAEGLVRPAAGAVLRAARGDGTAARNSVASLRGRVSGLMTRAG